MAEPIDLPFGCGLGWAKGSIVFVRLRQCAHGKAHWRHPMRPYVKLLLPLVIVITCYFYLPVML